MNAYLKQMRELEDFSWFPPELRRQQTAYIGWMVRIFKVYDFLVPLIAGEAAKHQGVITDLCSGNGGPWLRLAGNENLSSCSILLTDMYPHSPGKLPPNCLYEKRPVPATDALPAASGLVTMFNAFHHFDKQQRHKIIKDMMLNGRTFMACEILQPTVPDLLRILLATTIGQLFFAPFVTPFSWKRLIFTYLIPVNIITVTWDGLLSVLKSLGVRDWNELKKQAEEMGGKAMLVRKKGMFVNTTCFVCYLPLPGR